jgi:hypothetical protein
MNAVKIVMFNATAASIKPDSKEIYRYSPGFYLKDDTDATFATQENIAGRTGTTRQYSVGPPSKRTIAVQGALGISAGLTVILVTLLSQWFFLRHQRRRDGRTERADWQGKTKSDKSLSDHAERTELL